MWLTIPSWCGVCPHYHLRLATHFFKRPLPASTWTSTSTLTNNITSASLTTNITCTSPTQLLTCTLTPISPPCQKPAHMAKSTFSFAAAIEHQMARKLKAATITTNSKKKGKASPSLLRTPTPTIKGKRKRTDIPRETNAVTIDLTSSDDEDDNDFEYQDDEHGHPVLVSRPHKAPRLTSPQSPVEERDYARDLRLLRQASPASLVDPSRMPGLLEAAVTAPGFFAKRRAEAMAGKRKAEGEGEVELGGSKKRRAEGEGGLVESSVTRKVIAKGLGTPPLTQDVGDGDASKGVVSPKSPVESPRSPLEEVSPQQSSGIQQASNLPLTQSIDTAAPVLTIESPASPVEEVTTTNNNNTSTTPSNTQAAGATSTPTAPTIPTTETSSRFIPTSHDGISYRDPRQFSLKPPFWRAWTPKQYIAFAESLRLQFDPRPFASESGLPIEEITSVFHAAVVNPLYFPKEAAKRGEEGMAEQMELFAARKYATPRRYWGKGTGQREGREGKVFAEIKGLQKGKVELVSGREGNRVVLGVGELSEEDKKYLVDNLRDEDLAVLKGDLM